MKDRNVYHVDRPERFQIAQNTEDKAKITVANTAEKLRVLGHPTVDRPATGIVEIRAPISGVITDQQVTNAAEVQD